MFVERTHETLITLNAKEERLFRLPPMSRGAVIIRAFDAFTTTGPKGETIFHNGPTGDLELELRHANHLSILGRNFIRVDSLWQDDLWRLRVRRTDSHPDPAVELPLQRYKFEASYTSQLPLIERRIPASFFQEGFEANWNRQEYIKVRLFGSHIEFIVDEDLRLLHDLAGKYSIDISPLSFERTTDSLIKVSVGVGPRGVPPPGVGGDTVFFAARVDYPGNKAIISIPGPDLDRDLPEFHITFRFYLDAARNLLKYIPEVESNLFEDVLDISIPFPDPADPRVIKVKEVVKQKIEEGLAKLQRSEPGEEPAVVSKFGDFLKPWLIGGREELVSLGYAPGAGDTRDPQTGIAEPATGELLVRYVGARPPLGTTFRPDLILGELPTTPTTPTVEERAERLFNVPDEDPDPPPGGSTPPDGGTGIGGIPVGTPTPIGQLHRPKSGALGKIDHIIVLMQENRSFDQVLGYLLRDGINPKVDGLVPGGEAEQIAAKQFNRFKGRNFFPKKADRNDPRRFDPKAEATAWPTFSLIDPCHGTKCVLRQIETDPEFGNPMGFFVSNFAERIGLKDLTDPFAANLRLVMDYFDGDQLPVYKILAREFGICDRWYTAHAGATWPNRFVMMTGDLNRDEFGNVEENNPDIRTFIPSRARTIFDHLNDKGVGWRVFEHGFGFPRLFRNFTFDTTNIVQFDDPARGFAAAAHDGVLPSVSLIEPDYIDIPPGNDDHAPVDMKHGQDLVRTVVSALIASPLWEKTLLIITYDEHGGFYDHRVVPTDVPPLLNGRPIMGPRVPTFVISPLIEAGEVFHTRFDHTTIGATILRRFGGARPPKISARLDAAADLREVLTLDQPRPHEQFAGLFAGLPPLPARSSKPRTQEAGRAGRIGKPKDEDDFHWLLAALRLTVGEAPKAGGARKVATQNRAGELLLYRDKKRDGTGDVANPSVIGRDWQNFRFAMSGGNGVLYAVDRQGRLLFFRDATQDGTGSIGAGSVIGESGWRNFRSVFAGGDGIVYAVDQQGRLLFHRDPTQDGRFDIQGPSVIGRGGWQNFRFLFSGGDGIIYAVNPEGQLLFFRDQTQNGTGDVANPAIIGRGGWTGFLFLFSGGDGIIYAVTRDGRLQFFRDKPQDGTGDVANPTVIGRGAWQQFRFLFSGGNGSIYAVRP